MSRSEIISTRRVHVAAGHRYEPGGDARAADVERVGVGARAAAERLQGEVDLDSPPRIRTAARTPAGGGPCHARSRGRTRACARSTRRARPGLVGGKRHVDDDGHPGSLGEGARSGAGQPGLLLGHGQRHTLPGRAAFLGHQSRGLGGHEAADAVVEGPGDDRSWGSSTGSAVDHRDVADPDQLAGLIAVAGSDVDVELLELRDLLAVLVLQEVNRLARDTPSPGRCRSDRGPAVRRAGPGSHPPTSPKRR